MAVAKTHGEELCGACDWSLLVPPLVPPGDCGDGWETKADVVKFLQEVVADGAQVIQQQGDAGLDKTSKFFGNPLAHNSTIWTFAIEHSGEHYGQLVVYYRANNLVPPDTRTQLNKCYVHHLDSGKSNVTS